MAPILAVLAVLSALLTPGLAVTKGGCTASSFAMPSWFVDNFQYKSNSSTAVNVSFKLLNRATDGVAEASCGAPAQGQSGWTSCSVKSSIKGPSTSIQLVNATVANIMVNETWTCNDRNATHPLTFSAVGNNSVALTCKDGSACTSTESTTLVKGRLLAPVAITPSYTPSPGLTGHSNSNCSSSPPSWELNGIQFMNRTGYEKVTTASSQMLILQAANRATGYQAGCLGLFGTSRLTGPQRITCSGVGVGLNSKDQYRVNTETIFDPYTFNITVNQTWYCDQDHPARPVSITAVGSSVVPLNCTETANEEDVTAGTRKDCIGDNIIIEGKIVSEEKLEPYSIEDPVPTQDGCTVSSLLDPSWRFTSFVVERNSSTSTTGSVRFGLALNIPADRQYASSTLTGNSDVQFANGSTSSTWYPCSFAPSEDHLAPYKCAFQYNLATGTLDLKADWVCSDLDDSNPILFSGTTSTKHLPLACEKLEGTHITICAADDGSSWVAATTNVTAKSIDRVLLAGQ